MLLKRRIKLLSALSDKTKDVKELSIKSRNLDNEINKLKEKAQVAEERGFSLAAKRYRRLAGEVSTNKHQVDLARDHLAVITKQEKKTALFNKLTGGLYGKYQDIKKVLEENGKKEGKKILRYATLAVLLGSIVKLATTFAHHIDTLGKSFGVVGAQSTKLQKNLKTSSAEMIKLGGGLEQAISITNILSSDFGLSADKSAEMANNIFDSSVAMGLSADEGANLFGILMSMGNMNQKQAENLAESTYHLATANKVAPQAVMKDIAANANIFAKYMKDGGKNVMDAAVQAKKLGLSLSDVDTIASGLLDFQSSLNAEIEASIMLGNDINLQKARELALNDDLSGMMDEVLKQVGGEAKFNKLNRLEREALSKAIGVSASKMAKLVGEHGKLEEQETFQELLGPEALATLDRIINKIKSLGAVLIKEVGPVIEDIATQFGEWLDKGGFDDMKGFISGLANTIKTLAQNMGKVVAVIGGIFGASIGMMLGGPVGAAIGAVAGIGFGALGGSKLSARSLTKAAGGANFLTRGPQLMLVGDNPGGVEHVQVTPKSSNAVGAAMVGGSGGNTDTSLTNIKGELEMLRTDMASYFGFGGTAPKQMGKEFAGNMENIRNSL